MTIVNGGRITRSLSRRSDVQFQRTLTAWFRTQTNRASANSFRLFHTFSATRSRIVQPGPVDIHAHARADPAVHVLGHRVPLGHADLLERETGVHRTANCAHAQVLLLGGEPKEQERHRAKRPR